MKAVDLSTLDLGCDILASVSSVEGRAPDLFMVRWHCCGAETEIKRTSLLSREHHGNKLCQKCATNEARLKRRDKERKTPSLDKLARNLPGIEILKVLELSPRGNVMVATVRHTCCGKETRMTRKIMQQRKRLGTYTCPKCFWRMRSEDVEILRKEAERERKERAQIQAEPYGVTPPTWPKPPSVVVRQYDVWEGVT